MSMIAMISAEYNDLKEVTYANAFAISSAQKRSGNYSIYCNGGTTAEMHKTIPPLSECYLQFGLYMVNNIIGAIFGLRSGSTWLISLVRNASGVWEIRSGQSGTLLATGITPTNLSTWYLIELHFKLADSGGIAELRIDGNVECTFNGDTKPGSDTTFDGLIWDSWGSGPQFYVDDVVVNDTSGANNNSYPGGIKLCLLKPTSDGGTNEWTPSVGSDHYAMVDEIPPSGTDNLKAASNDLIELFGLEDMPVEAQSVKAVALDFYGLKGSTESPTRISQIVNIEDVNYPQADQDISFVQSLTRKILDTNPAGGNWNVAAVNAMKSGFKSRA